MYQIMPQGCSPQLSAKLGKQHDSTKMEHQSAAAFASSPCFERFKSGNSFKSMMSVLSPCTSSSGTLSSMSSISLLRSDSGSSCSRMQSDSADLQEPSSAALDASGSKGYGQYSMNDDSTAWLHQAPPYDLSQLDDDLLSISDSDANLWLHQAPPYNLSQLDDNVLAFSDSDVSLLAENHAWLHLAPPFNLAMLNDDLLSSQDWVSVSYMCQGNPLFAPQMDEQSSSAGMGFAVCFMCQNNPLFLSEAHGDDTLSTGHAITASKRNESFVHLAAPVVSDSKDAWLHQAAPFDLSLMNDDLLEFSTSTDSKDSNDSNASTANTHTFLHLAAPFDLDQLDDNLLSTSDSSTDKDAWLHQAAPFDLQDMDDDLLGGMI
jgi:hypothetical protein